MDNRRSQAAMEFLLTYGWAIVLVITAVAALSYFGVLKPERFMPEICTFPQGISCIDHSYEKGVLDLVIKNNLGSPIRIEKLEDIGSGCVARPYDPRLNNGQTLRITMLCEGFVGNLKIKYINLDTGLPYSDIASRSNSDPSSPDPLTLSGNEQQYCENANNNGLCSILDKFGDAKGIPNFKSKCCNEMSLCC